MPDTIRQRILDAIATQLATVSGVQRVYRAREAVELTTAEYPAFKLVDRGDIAVTRRIQCQDRRLSFEVVMFTSDHDADARDDTLATLLGDAEAALTADESWGDLAYETLVTSTDEAQSDAQPEAGRRTFLGEVGYRTALGDSTKVVVL